MLDQSQIIEVFPPKRRGREWQLRWTSSAPGVNQVYVNGELAWSGTQRSCFIHAPTGPTRIDIGAVVNGWGQGGWGLFGWDSSLGMEEASFSADLLAAPGRRARLTWLSGTYAGATLAGYRVYGEASPGAGIDYTTPLARITAYPGGIVTDGWGLGGWGQGGWGYAAGSFEWTSEPLSAGDWHFAVKPFDAAGNEGAASLSTVTIAAPPRAPAAYADGTRLSYTLSGWGSGTWGSGGWGLSTVTLAWNASP